MIGRVLAVVAGVAIACLTLSSASAQGWKPERNVELIVPAGAGGSLDATGRTIHRVWDALKLVPVPAAVINRGGGGHAKAYAYLGQQAKDPHFLSITSSTILTNHINGRLPHTYTAFTPLAVMVTEYIVFAVRPDSPLKSGRDLLDQLRKDPGSLSIGISSALGGTHHLSVALPAQSAGIDMKPFKLVAFNDSSAAVTALLGGHLDVISTSTGVLAPHFAEGRVRAIVVSSPKRMPGIYASTPTWPELGQKGVWENWRGVIAPKDITPQQVAYWEDVLRKVNQSKEFQDYAAKSLWSSDFKGAAETRAFMKQVYDELRPVMASLGLAK